MKIACSVARAFRRTRTATWRSSTGSGGVIRYGDVQRMSAGAGVTHSEFNASRDEKVHFLQIWLMPAKNGAKASYEEKRFAPEEKQGRLRLIASPDGGDGSLTLHQDARVYASILEKGTELAHALAPGRKAWVQVARGRVLVNGKELVAGDGAALTDERNVTLAGAEPSELLLFDLQ
jgi:quercetin 2,3-dioxygenase